MTYRDIFEEFDPSNDKKIKQQLKMGVKIEKEHASTYQFIKDYYKANKDFPPDEEVYKHIAMNHLDEFSNYYTELVKMEKKLKK